MLIGKHFLVKSKGSLAVALFVFIAASLNSEAADALDLSKSPVPFKILAP
jgi:hypothetical protein